jgi:hypothetical protein
LGGGKGTSTSKTEPPKAIMDAYKQSLDLGRQAISQPYKQYEGQLVAGLNPTQLQGIANVNAAQGAALPYIQQGAGYVNQAAQGVNPGMINQFMSPYLNNVVNATQKNLLESNAQQLAGLKGQAIQSGAFGGDRGRFAQAEMARQQGLAGGQVIGGLLNQGYGQALAGAQQNVQNMMQGGNMLGALGMNAQQSILQGAQAQMAAGAQQQATDQASLQAAYDQFLQRQAYPYQQAQFFANIAQGIGAGAGGTTSQTPAAPSFGSQILGGLTAIGSIWGASDERIKENIKPVGKTNDGQTIYKYNFKGSPKTEIGLIAQEVEKKNPDAVADFGGIKMVDYDAATQGSERTGKAFGGSSMGGLVTPDMQRQAFAQGGFGMVPYADYFKGMSYVPGGELSYRGQSPGSTLPAGYKMEELEKIAQGSDFDALNAMSEKDLASMTSGFGKLGTSLGLAPSSDGAGGARAPSYSGPLSSFGPGVTNFFSSLGGAFGFADGGGVVPRHGYATDGAVEDESALPPFLVKAESGGDFSADNELGYVGRGQFGEDRLTDAKRAGVLPAEVTLDQFKADPGLQKAVENWHVQDVNSFIEDRGLGAFVGKEINGVPVTPQGLLAVAHLGGKGGMEKFVKSGGRYNPKDANGTSLMDYLALAANTDASPSGVAPASDAPTSTGVVVPAADEAPAIGETPARNRTIIESLLGQDMSEQARMGMLAAGLAMLGGRSPYAGVNIGKGGLMGLQTYYSGLANQRELAKTAEELRLRGVEADTQRMQADTARMELNLKWMPYAISALAWQANPANAGLEMPPLYQKALQMLENGEIDVPGQTPNTSIPMPSTNGDTAPEASNFGPRVQPTEGQPSPEKPEGDAEVSQLVTPQASSEEAPKATEPEPPAAVKSANDVPAQSASLFDEHYGANNQSNPMYHFRYADALRARGLTTQAEEAAKIGRETLNTITTNKGFFSPRDSQFVPLPGIAESEGKLEFTKKQATDAQAFENELVTARPGLEQSVASLERLAQLITKLNTGPIDAQINEMSAYAQDVGIDIGQATDQQKFVKDATKQLFAQVSALGGRILVSEIEGLKEQANNPNLTPEANAKLIADALAVTRLSIKMQQEYEDWKKDPKTKNPYDISAFQNKFFSNPENNYRKIGEELFDKIDYMGREYPKAPFTNEGLDVNKLKVGKGYMFPADNTGKKFNKGWYYGQKEDGTYDIRPVPPPLGLQ